MDTSALHISADAPPASNPKRLPLEIWVALAILSVIAIALVYVTMSSKASLDQTGWALISGTAILTAILSVGTLMISRKSMSEDSRVPIESIFSEHSVPFLITQNDRPIAANKAYLELFSADKTLKAINTETIPPIDDLLDVVTPTAKQALYRLHNLRTDSSAEKAEFSRKLSGGEIEQVEVRVSGLGQTKLWEVMPIAIPDHSSPLFDGAPVGLMSVTPEGHIMTMNAALETWVGEDLKDAKTIVDILDEPAMLLADEPQAGRKIRSETRLKTSSGTDIPVVLSANWIQFDDGRYVAVTSIHGHSNIQTHRAMDKANLPADNISLEGLNKADSPIAAIEIDSIDLDAAKIVRMNKALRALFGSQGSALGLLSDLITVETNVDISAPIDTRLKNEAQTPVSVYVSPNHALKGGAWVYLIDISTRRSLENQLSQSQKMQAIGQLAAGVAHDFNNLLQAIRLNADELLGRHPLGDPSYPELQRINSTVTRAAALVSKLLAFSRQQTLRPVVMNLGEALSDIMVVLRQVMVERVKLDIVHGRDVPDILADKSQLETVLMNLCVNARDAMMEKGGGEIMITTDVLNRADIDDPALEQSLKELSSDKLAVISVTDNGSGIPSDILEKIFEPFFTTKEQGKGTGLGLATVYGIVQQSGGHLTVESTVGVGTSFRLYFPEVDAEKARAAAEAAAQAPVQPVKIAPADLAGQGNILFVEDEDNVRTIAAKTLRKRGYNVLEACDGEEALELLDEAEAPFDLLISDVVMPGVDGPTLLKRGKEKLGDARIVFISGYAEEDFSDLLAEHPDVSFLPKPFTLTQLAEKVKQEIGEVID